MPVGGNNAYLTPNCCLFCDSIKNTIDQIIYNESHVLLRLEGPKQRSWQSGEGFLAT
jgi:hypothetical protein